jgi:predicted Rossmann-fold nucleotide-binding protein
MGHAGAIISGGKGTADEKMKAMREAGIIVVDNPAAIGEMMEKTLKKMQKQKSKLKNAILKESKHRLVRTVRGKKSK